MPEAALPTLCACPIASSIVCSPPSVLKPGLRATAVGGFGLDRPTAGSSMFHHAINAVMSPVCGLALWYVVLGETMIRHALPSGTVTASQTR